MGYGKTPTEISNKGAPKTVTSPKGYQKKNFWKIKLETTKEVMKRAPRYMYMRYACFLFLGVIKLFNG